MAALCPTYTDFVMFGLMQMRFAVPKIINHRFIDHQVTSKSPVIVQYDTAIRPAHSIKTAAMTSSLNLRCPAVVPNRAVKPIAEKATSMGKK